MTDMRKYSASECENGRWAALVVVYKLTQVQDMQTRVALLTDAIGDLIGLDLRWDRVAAAQARLQGFAEGLAPLLEPGLVALVSAANTCAVSKVTEMKTAGDR